ncbi:hypothetical protein [Microbacterium sp. SD291]|uniref:hypothetical protein n=1 Tax=Microbacterium sp. SD291 TaxID=2782007 RepID=UPI001A96D5A6|nr:hypothetical protein [Microbacterium sp. SD291]MBO0980147.1 hypothetical protein [Microbacterium sp. SD291]
MDSQATRRGLPAAVVIGGLVALGWAAISILTGGGAAHADDRADSPLGDLTSVIGSTVTTATSVVEPIVPEVVAPVVVTVVAPVQQVVQQPLPVIGAGTDAGTEAPVPTAPVVEDVTDATRGVVTRVSDLLGDSPASQIVQPVTDAVESLPIVDRLLDELGVNSLLETVVGVVDDTTSIVGGVVENTVPPVLSVPDATVPDAPSPLAGPDSLALVAPATAASAPRAVDASTRSAPPDATGSAPDAAAPAPAGERSSPPPAGGAPAMPSSSAGPGGGSMISHARLSDVDLPALLAMERSPGASDDVLPTSLVADTDVSPD